MMWLDKAGSASALWTVRFLVDGLIKLQASGQARASLHVTRLAACGR